MSRLVVSVDTVETTVERLEELGGSHWQQFPKRSHHLGQVRAEHAAVHGMQVVGRHLQVRGIPILVSVLPVEEPWLQMNQNS